MEIQMHVATYAEPKTFFPFGEWTQLETSQFQHRVVLVESA